MSQADPFDAMGRSFNALQGAWDQGTRNQAGRAYASGDAAGAANALYSGGMISEGNAARTQQRADETRARGGQMTDALRRGDHAGAAAFAQTPEELQALQTFKQNASEQEIAATTARFGQLAAVAAAVENLPPEQQRAAAVRYAPQFGLDPAQIPEQIDAGWIEGVRMRALGAKDYLTHQDRVDDNRREDEKFAETRRHNQATEGVAQARVGVSQSRESRQGRSGGGSRSSGGSGRPASTGGSLPPGFTVRRP